MMKYLAKDEIKNKDIPYVREKYVNRGSPVHRAMTSNQVLKSFIRDYF